MERRARGHAPRATEAPRTAGARWLVSACGSKPCEQQRDRPPAFASDAGTMDGLHGTEALVVDSGDLADGYNIAAPPSLGELSRDRPADAAESNASDKRRRRRVDDDAQVHDPKQEEYGSRLARRLTASRTASNSHGAVQAPQLRITREETTGLCQRDVSLLPGDSRVRSLDYYARGTGSHASRRARAH